MERFTCWMLVEMVAMTSMRVRDTITLSWKFVTSKRKVMNPTMMRIVCCRNTPRRWYSIFLGKNSKSKSFFFRSRKGLPSKNKLHFSHTHITGVVNENLPFLDLVLKKVFLSWHQFWFRTQFVTNLLSNFPFWEDLYSLLRYNLVSTQ